MNRRIRFLLRAAAVLCLVASCAASCAVFARPVSAGEANPWAAMQADEPGRQTRSPARRRAAPLPPRTMWTAYALAPGDTLYSLARIFCAGSCTWEDLAWANPGLDPADLSVGRGIRIPLTAPAATLRAYLEHVRAGRFRQAHELLAPAARSRFSLEEFIAANASMTLFDTASMRAVLACHGRTGHKTAEIGLDQLEDPGTWRFRLVHAAPRASGDAEPGWGVVLEKLEPTFPYYEDDPCKPARDGESRETL